MSGRQRAAELERDKNQRAARDGTDEGQEGRCRGIHVKFIHELHIQINCVLFMFEC